jgi:hypothetical protein
LYLYDVKIQTDINQNDVKNMRENPEFPKMILNFFLGRASLKGDWAEINPKVKSGLLSTGLG